MAYYKDYVQFTIPAIILFKNIRVTAGEIFFRHLTENSAQIQSCVPCVSSSFLEDRKLEAKSDHVNFDLPSPKRN